MLIFVPPSETKAFPADAAPVDLGSLALPELTPTRARLLKALVRLARGRATAALDALGLSEGQVGELACNRELLSAPGGAAGEALLESGQQPSKPDEFTDLARALGYTVEPAPVGAGPDAPLALDIVVREL